MGNGGYTDPTNYLTPVGAFAASPGPYGTYDMGGDVWQWNEANISGSFRGLRGGGWGNNSDDLASSVPRRLDYPTERGSAASGSAWQVFVPEPGSITLVACGAICVLIWWRRRNA